MSDSTYLAGVPSFGGDVQVRVIDPGVSPTFDQTVEPVVKKVEPTEVPTIERGEPRVVVVDRPPIATISESEPIVHPAVLRG